MLATFPLLFLVEVPVELNAAWTEEASKGLLCCMVMCVPSCRSLNSNQAVEPGLSPGAVIWDQTAGCIDSFVLQCSGSSLVMLFVQYWLQFLLL